MRVLSSWRFAFSSKNSDSSGFALGYRRLPRCDGVDNTAVFDATVPALGVSLEAVDLHFLVPFVFQDNIVQVDEFVDMT